MAFKKHRDGTPHDANIVNQNFYFVRRGSLLPYEKTTRGQLVRNYSGSYDLGSSAYHWANIYVNEMTFTADLILQSGASFYVDGTPVYGYDAVTGTPYYCRQFTLTVSALATQTVAHSISSAVDNIVALKAYITQGHSSGSSYETQYSGYDRYRSGPGISAIRADVSNLYIDPDGTLTSSYATIRAFIWYKK